MERLLLEKPVSKMSPAELLKSLEASKRKDEREKLQKEKSKRYYKEIRKGRKYKEKRLAWQMERSKQKDRERREAEMRRQQAAHPGEVITTKDADPTAARKALGSAFSVASSLAKIGLSAAARRMQQKGQKNKNQDPDSVSIPTPPPPNLRTRNKSKPIRISIPSPPPPNLKNKLKPTSEGYIYSCWREEFLSELGTLRRKVKERKNEDDIIDVMKGKNKIIIHPKVSERFEYENIQELNSVSSMSRATPPISGVKFSSSRMNRQPGKYSADDVKSEIEKMYLGKRTYELSSDMSNYDADDGDISVKVKQKPEFIVPPESQGRQVAKEEYDDIPELRSRTVTNSSISNEADRRRSKTAGVLRAMAAMNASNSTKKKKKKKKNNEEI